MDRMYYQFPRNIDFERRYGFNADMRYLVKVMASLHGRSGSMEIETPGLDVKRIVDTVKAKRSVFIEITEKKMDFMPMAAENLPKILGNIPQEGIIDYRITVRYSYLDKNFDRAPLKSDVFMVRTRLEEDLTIQVTGIGGQGRTLPEEIANTVETQLKYYKE